MTQRRIALIEPTEATAKSYSEVAECRIFSHHSEVDRDWCEGVVMEPTIDNCSAGLISPLGPGVVRTLNEHNLYATEQIDVVAPEDGTARIRRHHAQMSAFGSYWGVVDVQDHMYPGQTYTNMPEWTSSALYDGLHINIRSAASYMVKWRTFVDANGNASPLHAYQVRDSDLNAQGEEWGKRNPDEWDRIVEQGNEARQSLDGELGGALISSAIKLIGRPVVIDVGLNDSVRGRQFGVVDVYSPSFSELEGCDHAHAAKCVADEWRAQQN